MAREWTEEHLSAEKYEEIFGGISENEDEKVPIGVRLTKAVAERTRREASKAGMSLSEHCYNLGKDYAYLFADAVVWSQLMSVCQLAGMPLTDDTINSIIRGINAAISVEETTKLRLERSGEDGGC